MLTTIGRERDDIPCLAGNPGSRPSSSFFFFKICSRMTGPYREQACGMAGPPRGCAGFGACEQGGTGREALSEIKLRQS